MAGARGRDGPVTVRSADPRPEPAIPARPVERLESLPAEAARAEVRREIETGDVVEFARGGVARGERAVAVVDAERTEMLGWRGLGPRVVRLSAETVGTHERFRDFGRADWQRVQWLVDEGAVVEQGARHRVVWIRDDGEPWVAVIKSTRRGEIYMLSYRRATERQVRKWQERGSGGP